MITAQGIDMIGEAIKNMISHAEVRVGDTWHRAADTEVAANTGEDKVMILATIPGSVAAGNVIDEMRIISVRGEPFCQRTVNITRPSGSTGLTYACEIFIRANEIAG